MQLATLLLLAALTSWLTSRLVQPDLTQQKVSSLRSSMEQADQRYSSLMKKLQAAEERSALYSCAEFQFLNNETGAWPALRIHQVGCVCQGTL